MNLVNGAGPPAPQLVRKQEAIEDRGGGKDIKPVKTTLNRVPRASRAVFVAVFSRIDSSCLLPALGACVSLSPCALSFPSL
jgi:hypothetical protein